MQLSEENPRIHIDPERRIEILLVLLQTNRQEIREWQKSLFDASLWFNAGILAITAFVHNLERKDDFMIYVVSLGIAFLAAFYLLFSRVGRNAVELSGNDLLKIQRALHLDERNYFIGGDSIYSPTGTWLPQKHVLGLQVLNISVSVLAILSLLAIARSN